MGLEDEWCPNPSCPDFRTVGIGNVEVFSYQEPRYRCHTCDQTFSANHDTIFFRLHTDRQVFLDVICAVVERNSLRGAGRIKQVKVGTILHWLELVGPQCTAVNEYFIRNLPLTQVQIDELWTFVKKSRALCNRMRTRQVKATIGLGRRLLCRVASGSLVI
jgi:transposase-like protein